MPSKEELIALFGDDFDDVLRGLSMLPPEARELLDNTMNKMIYDADIFTNRVNKTIQTQRAGGMSVSATSGILANDMATGGPIFGELKNSLKESLSEGIGQSGRAGSFQAYDPDEKTLFMWVTVAGHKVCPDCAPRAGQIATLDDWEKSGMPGTGWSVCKGYCYCILDPSGKIDPRIQMERAAERARKPREFIPLNGVEATPIAKKALAKAGLYVDGADDLLIRLAKKNGGKMEGLAYHMKGEASLIRKIVTESIENGYNARNVLVQNIKDALRYTMIVDDANYTKTMLKTIQDMKDMGWRNFKVKNTWGPNSGYKGVNTAWANPNGQYVELQFHTPVSFRVKMDQAHKIYEEIRLVGTTKARKKELNKMLVQIYKSVDDPIDYRLISQLDEFELYLKERAVIAGREINKIDDLLGTAKLPNQVNNINKVTGRFGYKQKPPWQVWEEILESTDYKNDLAKYSEFLEKNGLKGIADDLNILWKKQNLDGEAFFRYISSILDDSYTHFAHNKYMDHDAVLQAAFQKKVDKFMKTYLREKNIKLENVLQAMRYDKQFNQNMLKRYGFVDDAGNVKIYRGVKKSYFDETGVGYPKDYGEVGEMAINSAESWSTNATTAEKFAGNAGIVFEAEVPIERVIGSNFSFAHMKAWDDLKGAMRFSDLGELEIILGGTKPVNVKVFEFGG
tara:strand:- start:2232 stop:4274 length:2043 start_codon:yes stop_codon:yes gene_type:complete